MTLESKPCFPSIIDWEKPQAHADLADEKGLGRLSKRIVPFLVLVSYLIAGCSHSPSQGYSIGDGQEALNADDPVEAAAIWESLADGGSAQAALKVADLYQASEVANLKKSREFYRQAAQAGFGQAQYKLARLYYSGRGGGRNPEKAAKWFRKAQENGIQAADLYARGFAGKFEAAMELAIKHHPGIGADREGRAGFWFEYWLENIDRQNHELGQSLADAFSALKEGEARPQKYFALGQALAEGEVGASGTASAAAFWFREAAEQGHPQAQFNLALLRLKGEGVKKNQQKAFHWFQKAALEARLAAAQNNLGVMFAQGRGVAQNRDKAGHWYRKAAQQGYLPAQNNLGYLLSLEADSREDGNRAIYWYRKAARGGYGPAQYNLGRRYFQGQGVDKDLDEASRWYRKAAEQGNVQAQTNLGYMLANGLGVKQNKSLARKWLKKAADQGNTVASENLSRLF